MQLFSSQPLVTGKPEFAKSCLNFAQHFESKKTTLSMFAQTSTHSKWMGFAR